MVFGNDASCPLLNASRRQIQQASTTGRSPLLTDAATAQSLGLPHKMLGNGVAVIADRPDTMRPGVVVTEPAQPAIATNVMGAGPARVRSETVITEIREPQRR